MEPASVLPWAAVVIMTGCGDYLARRAAALEAHPSPRSQMQGRQLRLSLAWLRRAQVEQLARDGAERGSSDVGSSEVPIEPGGASLASRPPSARLTVSEVAERLDVGVRQVVNLCHGELSATKVDGRWLIDPDSVEDLMLRRKSA